MNKQDKEAFEKWINSDVGDICLSTGEVIWVWQAALEYERKRSKILVEALAECPIVGEIHRDSNERFKEWNLIHRNAIREATAKYKGEV